MKEELKGLLFDYGYQKQFHAFVRDIKDDDEALVWVDRIPKGISENGEVIWTVEFVHEEKFGEYKTSELVEWYEA